MTQVGCCLTGFLAHDNSLGLDESEGIDDDLAFDGLDGVNDDGDGTRRELFEGLLGVDIDGREPAAETRVRVIPANDGFWSTILLISRRHKIERPVLTVPFAGASPSSWFGRQDQQLRH